MVSFFGLKFGADKKKKEVQPLEPLPPPPQWKNDRTEVLLECSGLLSANRSRPGTAHSTRSSARRPYAAGENRDSSASSVWDLHDTDFRGVGAGRVGSSASISAGSGPFMPGHGHGLKSIGSEANLQLSLGARNGSSTSLAAPRLPFGARGGGGNGQRPESAHSMRNGREKPFMSPLDVNNIKESTPGIAGPPRSPLGQLELMSPVRSDTSSLLGEDPEKFAQDISDRVTQEERLARMKNEADERRKIQSELEATARRDSEASRPRTAGGYPSPPASVTSDHAVPSVLVPGLRSGSFAAPVARETRPMSRGRDSLNSHLTPGTGPRRQESSPTGHARTVSRGRQPSVGGGGSQPASRSPLGNMTHVDDDKSASRVRSQTADNLSPGSSTLRPHPPREPVRGATVPGVKPQRSPLFQKSNPFDLHKPDGPREKEDEEEPKVDYRAANAPYGIPSPPLSNRQRTSEEAEKRPVIRSVMAKRDTLVVGGPPRQSLGLQIDEFEKTLQQAQAMTALEKGPSPHTGSHMRGDSGGSSNYSDISESPMTIEPPPVSPKPFPLTPRPTTPGARSSSYSRDISQSSLLTLEPGRETAAGSAGSVTPTPWKPTNSTREENRDSPTAGRPPPTGATPVRRTTSDDHGNARTNAVASMANRIHRPSPDEYGIQIKRTESPFRTESPILKEVRSVSGTYTPSDGLSSNNSSRSNSPLPNHSHSVFSPPPLAKRPFPTRSTTAEWNHGPAPTAPPTTPLPIPEKSARRRKAQDTPGQQPQEKATPTQSAAPTPLSRSPGLASSVSIVPDLASNPNWPLPAPTDAPSSSCSASGTADGGFGARRSLLRDKRSAPAPLNIAATRFAEDIGTGGPWTPEEAARPKTAVAAAKEPRKGSLIRVDTEFEWKEERYSSAAGGLGGQGQPQGQQQGQRQQPAYQVSSKGAAGDESNNKGEAIGMARGLSLKYDQEREQQKRGRAKERMKLMRAWTIDETATSPTSPTAPPPRGSRSTGR
ncbi:hypothetical protein Daus18300_006980 [Diaporthe australafricana]|uniref:Uncharacterized protein n=1 Tax=Diaporthe australafricana TaxID=127596 RepID=A0ABR3WQQ3_9PEZI